MLLKAPASQMRAMRPDFRFEIAIATM